MWDDVPEVFREEIDAEHVVLVSSTDDADVDACSAATSNWRTLRFRELLVEPVRNGIYKRKEHHGRGTKIINMGELFANPRLRSVPMNRVALSKTEQERFSITRGDLLFARRSLVPEGAGRCCVVLDVDEPTTFESSIIRARPDRLKADSLFLHYFFGSPSGLQRLDTIRRHMAVSGITGRDLSGLEISVPSIPEQTCHSPDRGHLGTTRSS